MFDLITQEPDVLESDYKRCFKYPFMACETLCTQNDTLVDTFLDIGKENEGVRFKALFKVFDKDQYDEEVNSTLTGYVSRLIESLAENYP